MATMLERLRAQLNGESPCSPIDQLIGWTLLEVEVGRSTFALVVEPRHTHVMGVAHGSVLSALADAAMGTAYASVRGEGESFATVEQEINFVRPVRQGRVVASGRLVHRGHTLGLTECDIVDAAGRLVARSSATCMTLRGERAAGR
jgi:uncharacterized protein (TIGR00369 family)